MDVIVLPRIEDDITKIVYMELDKVGFATQGLQHRLSASPAALASLAEGYYLKWVPSAAASIIQKVDGPALGRAALRHFP